jgi:prolyl 4-hydroxylase
MLSAWLLLLIILTITQVCLAENAERGVKFHSNYDEGLNLYWIGDVHTPHDPVLIVEIQPQGVVDVSTFTGHLFYASKVTDNVRALPRRVTIEEDIDMYQLAPDETCLTKSEDMLSDETAHEGSHTQTRTVKGKSKQQLSKQTKRFDASDANIINKNRDPKVNNGLHPAVTLLNSGTQAMSVKFKNLSPGCDYFYDDGRDGIYQGRLELGSESTTNTYEGHIFYFTKVGDKSAVFARFVMHKDQVTYVITDPTSLPPRHLQEQADKERAFLKDYYDRTGIHWRHYYGPDGPRPPPVLYQWDAKEIGQVHKVKSLEGHWHDDCTEPENEIDYTIGTESNENVGLVRGLLDTVFGKNDPEAAGVPAKASTPTEKFVCQSKEPLNLEIEVISLAPRAFVIENFLSDYEADQIIAMSKHKLRESTVGNGDAGGARSDNTRTSKNAWLGRESNKITESLFMRAADVLNLDEKILYNTKNAEDMQVVHYVNGQKYDSHHDWGVSGYPESRFITLLMYLTDQPSKDAGGETAFPKAADGGGIKVHPGKGGAVLFYNLLEDGNGDDLALHAALPVKYDHEKWLANYWVWDSKRK